MIKRLIFDLDNTLIDWQDSYYEFAIKNTCNTLNLKNYEEISKIVINTIEIYEKHYDYFSIENLVNLLNTNGKINFSTKFVQTLLENFSLCVPNKPSIQLLNTLEYLSKKYSLVILTNWFESYQVQRLKRLNILQYFEHVYATEKIKNKPNKESFEAAIENYNLDQCIMIGDSYINDIQGALNFGINAIFYNRHNVTVSPNITTINTLEDLKNIL